jgi:DNA-binding transcriptional LysR family regulator
LIPILADFFRAYSQIDVRLVLTDRIISLLEEHVDVALRNGALPDSNLIAMRVGTARRVVCASPTYLQARGTPRTPDELSGHDCISYEGFFGPNVWTFVRGNANVVVPIHSRLVVGSVEEACDAAHAGVGITTAFSFNVKAALDAGTLMTLLDDFQPPAQPISFVHAAGRFLPIKVRAFLDFAAPRLRTRLAAMRNVANLQTAATRSAPPNVCHGRKSGLSTNDRPLRNVTKGGRPAFEQKSTKVAAPQHSPWTASLGMMLP